MTDEELSDIAARAGSWKTAAARGFLAEEHAIAYEVSARALGLPSKAEVLALAADAMVLVAEVRRAQGALRHACWLLTREEPSGTLYDDVVETIYRGLGVS